MQTIGRYEVLNEIARGGMGTVFRARDPISQRQFAIKLLTGVSTGDRMAKRLRREADALTRLRHPHIVAVHEIGEDKGLPFLVLDLVEGEDLDRRITRQGPLPSREAAKIVVRLAEALAYAHQSSVLHRDIKPGNVLLDAEGSPRLSDFGMAKDLQQERSSLTTSGQMMGTPGYWPPEQARGDLEQVGPASDVYGLGATLYAALTGDPPIPGNNLMEVVIATVESTPVPPSRKVAGVAPDLERICMRCLEKDPGRRYPSASALGTDLERFLRGDPLADAPTKAVTRGPAPLLAGGIVLVGVVAAVLLLRTNSPPPLAKATTAATPESAVEASPAESRPPPVVSPPPATPTEPAPPPVTAPPSPTRPPSPSPSRTRPPPTQTPPVGELVERGLQLAKARNFTGALEVLDRAVDQDPAHTGALHLRGKVRSAAGDPAGALQDLDRVIELDPDDVAAYISRGRVFAGQGDHERAHEEFNLAKNKAKSGSQLYFEAKWAKDAEKRILKQQRGE